jgi:hypothetical protein
MRRTLEEMRIAALAAEAENAPGEATPCPKCGCTHFLPRGPNSAKVHTMRCRHCGNSVLVPVNQEEEAPDGSTP